MNPQIQTPVPHEQTGTRRGPKPGCTLPRHTDEQIHEVRRLLNLGMSYSYIRKHTKVSEASVCQIAGEMSSQLRNRLTWSARRGKVCDKCDGPKVNDDYGRHRCVFCDAEAERERRLAAKRKGVNQGVRG